MSVYKLTGVIDTLMSEYKFSGSIDTFDVGVQIFKQH